MRGRSSDKDGSYCQVRIMVLDKSIAGQTILRYLNAQGRETDGAAQDELKTNRG